MDDDGWRLLGREFHLTSADICIGNSCCVHTDSSDRLVVGRASATHLSDSSEFGVRTFDVVTGTPPYFDMGSFVQSPAVNQKGPCRMELRGGTTIRVAHRAVFSCCGNKASADGQPRSPGAEEYMLSAQRHLADGGVFVMCETSRKEAAARVERCAAELRLEIVERWDFVTKLGKPPRFGLLCLRQYRTLAG